MESSLLVSIVIPSHDRAQTLALTLDELSAVEPPVDGDCEALVVANGCTDSTVSVVQEIARDYPFRLTCIERKEGNLNRARNAGAEQAIGDIVAFLDDDVSVAIGWLRGLIEGFNAYPADIVAGRVTLTSEDGGSLRVTPPVEALLSKLDLGENVVELDHPRLVGANFAMRRALLDRFRFRPELDRAGSVLLSGGDTELASRAIAAGHRLFYVPEASVAHRIPPDRLEPRSLARLAYGRGRTRTLIARLGDRRRGPSLFRLGLRQVTRGIVDEVTSCATRDTSAALDARLLWMRGMGTLVGLLAAVPRRHRDRPCALPRD